jgi:hypothetical protein
MLSLRAGILILLLAMLAATLTGAAVRYYRRGLLPWDFGRIAGHGTTLAGGGVRGTINCDVTSSRSNRLKNYPCGHA